MIKRIKTKTLWKSIQINKQNIKADTDKATLIAMPHNSDYNGFKFWFPNKLISSGKYANTISIAYNDGFIFNLKKYGKGKFNKNKIIEEKQISYEEFEEAFTSMNKNISFSKNEESYLIISEPKKVDKEIKVLDELKNEKY